MDDEKVIEYRYNTLKSESPDWAVPPWDELSEELQDIWRARYVHGWTPSVV